MPSILESIDLRDSGAVIAALDAGAAACLNAPGRRGATEWVEVDPQSSGTPAGTLIATGDLHDNPLHLARIARAAGIIPEHHTSDIPHPASVSHLTLHELIHGDRLVNGLDYSYRVLARAAAMKGAFPERVHVLLANHEIAQLAGTPVAKEGVRCNEAFDEAIEVAFGDDADQVRRAVHGFLFALPLLVRFRTPGLEGDLICAHSLPGADTLATFDFAALDRLLSIDDFAKRTGAARALTWGRNHTPDQIADLARTLDARLFILGHEKADEGYTVLSSKALILNSDHDRGVYARVDLTREMPAEDVVRACVRLADH